ncbi:MAG: hypothetical protein A2583_12775 [Bdellovibrionales bacterium RIFOXYD1_FULL_53_11]|nr:MAG: hypothetical protein A2583_12775 [Bdellovibrionales bacterium RIFOXYD1_FULL_53_11]
MSQKKSGHLNIPSEISRVLSVESRALDACARKLSAGPASVQAEKAVKLLRSTIKSGGKIITTGIGKSGKVAVKIAATLSSTGSLAIYLHPAEGLHGDIGMVSRGDAVLAVSHGGNSEEITRLLPLLKKLDVPVIAICGNPKSVLVEKSDAWLDASIEQEACPHNLTPTASTTLSLAIGDAIAITLMQLEGFDADSFAVNHPGGALGRRLNLRVSDIMHGADRIATVSAGASMDEVVVLSTEKKLGAVVVADGTKMLGIITDGDIRRALQHKEKFFKLRASDVMTKKPVSARPEMMAREALELMENRPSQIGVLPVTDERGNCLGLLRLHDLAKLI